VHVPQLRSAPQPLDGVPHEAWSAAHVVAAHVQTPALQVYGAVQAQPVSVPPQPFGWFPHASGGQLVLGVQPHVPGVPPAPHMLGEVHAGH